MPRGSILISRFLSFSFPLPLVRRYLFHREVHPVSLFHPENEQVPLFVGFRVSRSLSQYLRKHQFIPRSIYTSVSLLSSNVHRISQKQIPFVWLMSRKYETCKGRRSKLSRSQNRRDFQIALIADIAVNATRKR